MLRVLEQVGVSTGLERTDNLHVACVSRQHDDSCVGKFISNSNERIQTVHLRHLQIHQRNVRMVRPELLDGLATVGGFTYYGHVRLDPNQTGDPFPHEWMVVNCENSNLRASGAHDRFRISFHAVPSRQTFVKLTNSLELRRKRYRQGGAIPLPYLHQLRSTRSAWL